MVSLSTTFFPFVAQTSLIIKTTEWDSNSQTYGAWPLGISNVVQAPAKADILSEMQANENFLQGSQRFKFITKKLDDSLPLNAQEQRSYDDELAAMDERKARIAYLKSLRRSDHYFGYVKMASGYRMSRRPVDVGSKPTDPKTGGPRVGIHPLDWAIGEPKRDGIGGNILPSQAELERHLADSFILGARSHVESINQNILGAGSSVFKIGRTTGLTTGVVHAVPVITNAYTWPPNARKRTATAIRARCSHQGGDRSTSKCF